MSFETLSIESLQKVRPLLEKKLPKSTFMLNLVDITISKKYEGKDFATLYGYNGTFADAEDVFLVAVCSFVDDSYTLVFNPDILSDEMLLAFTNFFDWNKHLQFGAIPANFSTHLKTIFAQKGGSGRFNPCTDMYLPIEDALKLDLSRDDLKGEFEVDKLTRENGSKVNSFWKFGTENGQAYIEDAIDVFGGAGVFKKDEVSGDSKRSNENLVSWVVFLRVGTINALYTLDEFRGKGLGRWTMEAVSKFAAQQGYIPLCEIEAYNQQSKRLVERIGFKEIQEVDWIQYTPNTSSS